MPLTWATREESSTQSTYAVCSHTRLAVEARVVKIAIKALARAIIIAWIIVITYPVVNSTIIIEQDGRPKSMLRHKRFAVTLDGRQWQWVSTDNTMTWHANCEIWELNSQQCPFFVPNSRGPQKTFFCSALQKWQMRSWILFAPSILPWGIVLLLKIQI